MPLASSFLAGSILSLLLPVLLFIALVVWYVRFVRAVPDTADATTPGDAVQANVGVVEEPPADAAPPSEH
jgi:hypothetical protein